MTGIHKPSAIGNTVLQAKARRTAFPAMLRLARSKRFRPAEAACSLRSRRAKAHAVRPKADYEAGLGKAFPSLQIAGRFSAIPSAGTPRNTLIRTWVITAPVKHKRRSDIDVAGPCA